jgi:hypothetical protein
MADGCAANCAKVLLIVFNILFILSGLALIGIGIWLIADPSVLRFAEFIVSERSILFRSSAILLITMGAFILVVSIIGFVGAMIESTVVIGIYIVLVSVVFAGEAAGAIIAVVYKDEVRNEIDSTMRKSIQTTTSGAVPYYTAYNTSAGSVNCKTSTDVAEMWDYIQVMFDCCGVGNDDQSGYELSTVQLSDICPMLELASNRPQTCCYHDPDLKPIDSSDQVGFKSSFDCSLIVSNGCADSLYQWVEKYAPVLIGIGFGIGMFELIVVVFAVCLCQHINHHKLNVS